MTPAKLRQVPRDGLMALVRAYRFFLSPWLGSACRFEPTCSAYALQALQRHGAVAGSWLTGRRLLRCHPWCAGGHDPVPDNPALFTRWVTPDLPPPAAPSPSDPVSRVQQP
jgi:uncharacterized protein